MVADDSTRGKSGGDGAGDAPAATSSLPDPRAREVPGLGGWGDDDFPEPVRDGFGYTWRDLAAEVAAAPDVIYGYE